MEASSVTEPEAGLRAAIAANPLWYHTMELAPGVVTPGWFDLRPIVGRLPWPDVRGKRCLDVGTYDGFLAFELERRGASEVVATDIGAHEQWDWPAPDESAGLAYLRSVAADDKARGFETARRALGSSAERVELSVYDISPERLGEFDVVVCGSLLLHLRSPADALGAIRSVCRRAFLSAEQISLSLTLLHPRRPLARLRPLPMQWWVPNSAGHAQMLHASGFEVERRGPIYAVPFGPSHRALGHGPRALASRVLTRLVAGGVGVPHRALLARPAG